MDQGTLVREKLDAGKAFVDELAKSMTVKVAFWLKLEADSQWYLYVASEQVSDATIREAYKEVLRVAGELNDPDLDPFEVKLIEVDDPFAVAAWEIMQRKLSRRATIALHRDRQFGGVIIQGAYLYSTPVAAGS